MEDYLLDLNEPQRKAVENSKGPLLVLAGAGSGKTRVITYRTIHFIRALGVHPENILALTFTNKAAREMSERIVRSLGVRGERVWVSTFHSFGSRLLRKEIHRLGYSRSFVIYDESDQLCLIRQVMEEMNISKESYSARLLLSTIDRIKNGSADEGTQLEDKVQEFHRAYQEKLRCNNALDFGDLLCLSVCLLSDHANLRAELQGNFRYVMVDEYQDTSRVQFELLRLLCSSHRNLCVVGDDDQSIYSWRGARVRNILNFEEDYPDATVIKLEQNYRSTQMILAAADALIDRNLGRTGKTLWTENPRGQKLVWVRCRDEHEESRALIRELKKLREEGFLYRDAVVFYRINALSRALEEELVRCAIPYQIVGGLKFYDRKEIKDLLAFLRVIAVPEDQVSLDRILNVPPRGIGEGSVGELRKLARRLGIPLYEALARSQEVLSPVLVGRVSQFHVMMESFRKKRMELTLPELLQSVIEEISYRDYVKQQTSSVEERLDNIQEFFSLASEFSEMGESGLKPFLDHLALVTDQDGYEADRDRLTLMTVHTAKGLEFPIVFIIGMDDHLLPHIRSQDGNEEIEEERRLCYVGMTRAKERLYFFSAQSRRQFGKKEVCQPSRFIGEIPTEFLDTRGGTPTVAIDWSYNQTSEHDWDNGWDSVGIAPGRRVRHPTLGVGTVRKTENSGDGGRVWVQFEREGLKQFVIKYARLEPF
jgi:DNA helicase-2/ATP-dependent DNA helicase PcrA